MSNIVKGEQYRFLLSFLSEDLINFFKQKHILEVIVDSS